MTEIPETPDRLVLQVCRDGSSRQLQVSLSRMDENGAGHGYRLAGPKFSGTGEVLVSRTLDEDDATQIRRYLDAVFPVPPAASLDPGPLLKLADEWQRFAARGDAADECAAELREAIRGALAGEAGDA